MKQRIFCCIVAVLLILSITAHAHPGRTDSSGGHHDRSSGGYHYHHGYSEHQHYDMDGDGKKDCPYDFKDNTNHSDSTSAGSSYSTMPNNKTTYEEPTPPEKTVFDWIGDIVFFGFVVPLFFVYFLYMFYGIGKILIGDIIDLFIKTKK